MALQRAKAKIRSQFPHTSTIMSSTPPPDPPIPIESFGRGCSSSFSHPISETNQTEAEDLARRMLEHNIDVQEFSARMMELNTTAEDLAARMLLYNTDRHIRPALRAANIIYRTPDTLYPVYRWNNTDFHQVFERGFRARDQQQTSNKTYYNMAHHVTDGGVPLDPTRRADNTHVFVSTGIGNSWHPTPRSVQEPREVYLYEIYAPGGIWVGPTLRMLERPQIQDENDRRIMEARERYASQEEVAFVRGIAPQFIRSAQRFIIRPGADGPERENGTLFINTNFNPEPDIEEFQIQNPLTHYDNGNGRQPFEIIEYPPRASRQKRDKDIYWYKDSVANVESYIDAAFRSNSNRDEVYLFMKNEYVHIYYAPGATGDKVINGPLLIRDGFPSLANTPFGEYGIHCAFGVHNRNEAFIFSGNLCARIDYAPGTANDKILKGPMPIIEMFPFLQDTVFQNGIDAAFESTIENRAYLFKGDQYAQIDYSTPSLKNEIYKIGEGYRGLKDTIFESGIDAAFASSKEDEAYIFRGDQYARINFAPGTNNDYIMGGVKPILPYWHSLKNILPHKNRGVFVDKHCTTPTPSPIIHDEL